MSRVLHARGWMVALLLACAACKGSAPRGGPVAGPADPDRALGCDAEWGAPDRRLTRFELAYAVEDVLGEDATLLRELPRPLSSIGDVPDILVGRLLDTSDRFLGPYREKVAILAERIGARLAPACPGAGGAAVTCVTERLQEPAARLWRRTLDDDEKRGLREAAEKPSARGAQAMFAAGVAHLLGSPKLYILSNEAQAAPADDSTCAPTEEEVAGRRLASRLGLVLWSSVPDLELVRRAESGALADPARFASEIARMMADRRFERFARELARQWLRLDRPPTFRPSLETRKLALDRARLREIEDQVTRFVQRQIAGDRPVDELLTAGDPAPAGAGLLASGAVLGAISTEIRGGGDESWLGRGIVVQAAFLCRTFPLAAVYPPQLWADHPLLDPHVAASTPRPGEPALLALRTRDRPCRECHRQLETIGAALWMYDGFGRRDPSARGGPAEIAGHTVEGPAELARWILATGRFEPCVAQKLLTYVLGRAVLPSMRGADRCLVRELSGGEGGPRGHTLSNWLWRALGSAAFRGQGPQVVRDRPIPSPNSNGYRDALAPVRVGAGDCARFAPGTFLVDNCGSSACHGPGSALAAFAVADARAARSLLRGARPAPGGYCGGEHTGYVSMERPHDSLVIQKVTAGGGVCGAPMPIAGGPREIDPVEHACFVRWIEEDVARGGG